MTPACTHRWMASRPETDTAPVQHVCIRTEHHVGDHICVCTARTESEPDGEDA